MTVEAVSRYLKEKADELTDNLLPSAQAEVLRNLQQHCKAKADKIDLQAKSEGTHQPADASKLI